MSSGGPDLFVVCKSCGSEVSPYVTECPYCGTRLRKRAPKIERVGRAEEESQGRTRGVSRPKLPPLRRDEIPGIAGERRPYATAVLVLLALAISVAWRTGLVPGTDIVLAGKPGDEWWRLFSTLFVYDNTGYELAVVGTVALFGWLLERRHGPVVVVGLFLAGGAGGALVASVLEAVPVVTGANGAALALLAAWALPDLLALRRREEIGSDLLGVGVIALVLLLMPAALPDADWIASGAGLVIGLGLGAGLAPLARR